eukprot:scaffold2538_cov235-Pinguiococcus_pyrenoidosus.AAC.7
MRTNSATKRVGRPSLSPSRGLSKRDLTSRTSAWSLRAPTSVNTFAASKGSPGEGNRLSQAPLIIPSGPAALSAASMASPKADRTCAADGGATNRPRNLSSGCGIPSRKLSRILATRWLSRLQRKLNASGRSASRYSSRSSLPSTNE